jgi:hypothetical protein
MREIGERRAVLERIVKICDLWGEPWEGLVWSGLGWRARDKERHTSFRVSISVRRARDAPVWVGILVSERQRGRELMVISRGIRAMRGYFERERKYESARV